MAIIRPFRALRPRPDRAARIAAVPYDVVSTEEARALAKDEPLSFLHVSRAEIDLPPETNPYSDAVYAKAVENFTALGPSMVREAEPSLYFYRLRMGSHEQTGLAACYSVAEYTRDLVKKHEKTRKEKEDDRTRHIIDLRAQTGPVFLTYRHDARVDAIAARVCGGAPLYDLVAPDGIAHTVWRADAATTAELVAAFGTLPALYIADGHHRAASAARAWSEFSETAGPDGEHAWFLAVAFPDDRTQILPYNRTVRDLNGHAPDALLAAISKRFTVSPGPAVPSRKGECAMYLGGQWHTIRLLPPGAPAGADPIKSLDVSLLQDAILEPLLGVADPRTDKRIDFVGGIRGTGALEQAVGAGRAAVAFSMFPVTVAELMAIADAGAIMPPKSTWFEPKLRDGLLNHLI
jgi:uncharacterized protein (DUF1015 family)